MKCCHTFLLYIILALAVLCNQQAVLAIDGAAPAQDEIIIYYFHGNQRCPTCRNIEELSRTAARKVIGSRYSDIPIRFLSVNVDEESNEHFIQDYQLLIRSVVIAKKHNGQETGWRRLDKVWQLHSDPAAFFEYFDTEAQSLFTGNSQ